MERKRDAERKAKGKGKDGAKGAGAKEEEKKKDEGGDIIHGEGMAAAAKVIERRVNQNTSRDPRSHTPHPPYPPSGDRADGEPEHLQRDHAGLQILGGEEMGLELSLEHAACRLLLP